VSLPGGIPEGGESLPETALREAEEEVGLPRAGLLVLGGLTPVYIPVSGYRLYPFVGIRVEEGSPFRPRASEVHRILEVPLLHLSDPGLRRVEERRIRGRRYRVPYFLFGGEKVWGATAMILAEFAGVLGASGISPEPPWPPPG
jgi:8-oxo-dGTP pyrophosphatase MutT (NUDIX family)